MVTQYGLLGYTRTALENHHPGHQGVPRRKSNGQPSPCLDETCAEAWERRRMVNGKDTPEVEPRPASPLAPPISRVAGEADRAGWRVEASILAGVAAEKRGVHQSQWGRAPHGI